MKADASFSEKLQYLFVLGLMTFVQSAVTGPLHRDYVKIIRSTDLPLLKTVTVCDLT